MDLGKIILRVLMFGKCLSHWITGTVLVLSWASLSHAAVSLDGTLGPAGTLPGPDYQIGAELGRQVGGNLFHSFDQFSLNTGESAIFSGPNSVTNIIGRVTGGNESFIDGTLRSTIPGANLYLLNPAGVLFGEHAQLDVPGSFHISTADYLRLSDGGRFDARTPANSVLTVAPISAFGFLGGTPGRITVEGAFLKVPEGQTLSLIGGDITLTNATLYAPAGRINLVSVRSAGEVFPTETDLMLESFGRLGAILIERTTLERRKTNDRELGDVDTSGQGGGAIFIRGEQWTSQGGWVLANTLGGQNGRGVDVVLSGAAQLEYEAQLTTDTFSTGDAGSITLRVGSLELSGGSQISAHANIGRGGDITITARDAVVISGMDSVDVTSGLFTYGDVGDAGSITLNVGRLELSEGGQIVSTTQGTGKGGDIKISARDHITIRGIDSGLFTAAIPDSTNDAGSITLHTGRLDLSGGATISSATSGAGRGGDVNIFANMVNLSEGGSIFTGTYGGIGHGGNILLIARDTVTISGMYSSATHTFPSSLFSSSAYGGTGNAGNITVATPHLTLSNGGTIEATSELTSGGNITLYADHLKLLDGSTISSTVEGDETTTGGNITINSINVVALNDSKITAKANRGKGGNITVNADVFLHDASNIEDVLDASSQVEGNDGTVQNNAPTIDISGSLTALNTKYLGAVEQLTNRCGAGDRDTRSRFTVHGRGALPPEPDQPGTVRVTSCPSESPTPVGATSLPSLTTDMPATATLGFGDR